MKKLFKKLVKKDDGATAVEYGIMVALIAGVIVAAVTLIGGNLNTTFTNVAGVIPAGPAGP